MDALWNYIFEFLRFNEAETELRSIAAVSGSAAAADALDKAREFVRFCRENREILKEYRRLLEDWQFCSGLARDRDRSPTDSISDAPWKFFFCFILLGPVLLVMLLRLM